MNCTLEDLNNHLQVLESASKHTENVLYVHIDMEVPCTRNISFTQASSVIRSIYSQTNNSLDVRVILTGFKGQNTLPNHLSLPIHTILIDQLTHRDEYTHKYQCLSPESNPVILNESEEVLLPEVLNENDVKVYKDIVGGGTFDHIHNGHKILLSEGILRCSRKFTLGMADGDLLKKKTLKELIQPVDIRIDKLKKVLSDMDPSLIYDLQPIYEPLGPSGVDPDMEMIIVSQETLKGGNYVNTKRAERGLSVLDVEVVDLVEECKPLSSVEETKVSSSTIRLRQLGTLLRPPKKIEFECKPYIIGLTGVSASGKSSVSRKLNEFGAEIIDCDKLGHKAYEKGTSCYQKVTDKFGKGILDDTGAINRKALGAMVFNDEEKVQQLNDLVWPEIASTVRKQILESEAKVVVLDAAVLLEANWQNMCNEVCWPLIFVSCAILKTCATTDQAATARSKKT